MKYDFKCGVYFVYYLEKYFDWYFKKLFCIWLRKKKYKDKFNEDYEFVSYEEVIEKRVELGDYLYGVIKIGDMIYDDNFDFVIFDWLLKELK